MSPTTEVSEETLEALDSYREGGETYEELIVELVHIYEQEGAFTREGGVTRAGCVGEPARSVPATDPKR